MVNPMQTQSTEVKLLIMCVTQHLQKEELLRIFFPSPSLGGPLLPTILFVEDDLIWFVVGGGVQKNS